jgi:histone deacetylase complex regulatory component SIN3
MHARKNPEDLEEEEAAATAPATVEDAIGYVETVKAAFKDRRPATYHEFLRVMDDFRNHR